MTCWAIAQTLLNAGHPVTVVALSYLGEAFDTTERRAAVRELGASLILVDATPPVRRTTIGASLATKIARRTRWALKPDAESFFPTLALRPRMQTALQSVAPDVILAYHWDSLAAIQSFNHAPRMAVVGDPWPLPALRRWQHAMPKPTREYVDWTIGTIRDIWHCPRIAVDLLKACDASGCFQADAARWLRKKGAPGCAYLRSPIVDVCGDGWRQRRAAARPPKPTILLGPSNLGATSTAAGVQFFANAILPRLEKALGPDAFVVRVVGEGTPPRELAELLPRSSVQILGRVEPADSEFLAADVQLVPTPFVLGVRIRIIVGFSFGCCVVAHRNEARNIPEMIDGENALLAGDGPGLSDAIIRALRDSALRDRLSTNARRTYERYFTPEAAAAPILTTLERLAQAHQAQRVS
jgi:hypothetical protein